MTTVELIAETKWSIVVLILGVVLMTQQREKIAQLISRIRSMGQRGIELGESDVLQPKESEIDDRKKFENLMAEIPVNKVLRETEDNIEEVLKGQGMTVATPTEKFLLRYVAHAVIDTDFERVHGSIFGSQLRLLKELNRIEFEGASKEQLNEYYSKAREAANGLLDSRTIESYLAYLENYKLITWVGGKCKITIRGKEYLAWIGRNSKLEEKPL